MHISNLRITNFRNITAKTIHPAQLQLITGPNGSGKSSILEALAFLLTGKCGEEAIQNGASMASVSADIAGVPVERRLQSGKMTIRLAGKVTTQKSFVEWLSDTCNVTLDTLKVATSSGILAAMNGRQLSEYLINNGLIPCEVDMDTVKMLCTITPEMEDALLGQLPPAPHKFGLDELNSAYNTFFAQRPALKRALQDKRAQAAYDSAPPSRTLEQIDNELARIAAHKAAYDGYTRLLRQYNMAVDKKKQYQAQLEGVNSRLRGQAPKPVDPNELTFLQKQRRAQEETYAAATAEIRTLEQNISLFKRTLESLGRPICPISNKLVCTTDKTAIREEMQAMVSQNETLIKAAQKRQSDAKAAIAQIDAKINEHIAQDRAFQNYTALYNQKRALEASVPVVPEMPTPPSPIGVTEADAEALRAERQAIFAYAAAQKAANEIPQLEKELILCEQLISLLSPKGGVREQIVKATFEPLVEHCNERAAQMRADFAIDLVSDDGIQILCKPRASAELLPLSVVSSGEQVLAMLLVMDAINALSGLGIMVLDDLDKLDAEALEVLFKTITDPTMNAGYDHVFIAMVNHDDAVAVASRYGEINTVAL